MFIQRFTVKMVIGYLAEVLKPAQDMAEAVVYALYIHELNICG